jgi:hypothetical protein
MGGTGKKSKPPVKPAEDRTKTPSPPPPVDGDYEDGDIATPKHDHEGTDDEPL